MFLYNFKFTVLFLLLLSFNIFFFFLVFLVASSKFWKTPSNIFNHYDGSKISEKSKLGSNIKIIEFIGSAELLVDYDDILLAI